MNVEILVARKSQAAEEPFPECLLRLHLGVEPALSHDAPTIALLLPDYPRTAIPMSVPVASVAESRVTRSPISSALFNVACALLAVIIVGMLLLSSASHPTVSGHTEPAGPRIAPDVEATAPLLSIRNRNFSAGATDGQIVWRQLRRGRSK